MTHHLPTVLSLGISVLIAGIFVTAGLSKLAASNRAYYQSIITNYDITPSHWSTVLVIFIGSIECVTALLTIIPGSQQLGLALATLLLMIYTAAFIKQIVLGKRDIDCGCGGRHTDVKIGSAAVRNLALIGACAWAMINAAQTHIGDYFIALPLAATLGLIYLTTEQLSANNHKIAAIRKLDLIERAS